MSADHCLSEPIVILDLNMSTVITATVEECEAKFDYIVNKYGTFHGFASWFKVYFDEVVPTICLSTAPDSSPTHWKQDLFLIDDPLEVSKGQRLTGSIKLTRSKVWRRHLRVSISYTLLLEEDIIANKTTKEYKIWR
jgi:protein arginine N-methyltransferase 2